MRTARKRWRPLAIVAIVLCVLAIWWAWPLVTSAAMLLDFAGTSGWARRLLPVRSDQVTVADVTVPTRHGDVPARLYTAASSHRRRIIVFPGIHAGGVDEPRLDTFVARLAGGGATVLSVPLPDLRTYRITSESTDVIEDAVRWFASLPAAPSADRVGVIGVSFSGGLALVAAGRPSLDGRITAVVSLGGHGNLPRVMKYLCNGQLPDGSVRPPHDYGAAIIMRSAVAELGLVPPAQRAGATDAIVTFLDASSYAESSPSRAERLLTSARAASDTLDEPARTLVRHVIDRDVSAIGSLLLPHVEQLGGDPALSPERSPATRAPVFLLHGRADNVIPSTETPLVATYLARQGNDRVEWLLTPIVSHAELQPSVSITEGWRLVRFWARIWAALDSN